MNIITSRAQWMALSKMLGVRPDWHEPDEQYVTARVEGLTFDNAGFWPTAVAPHPTTVELHVIISTINDNDHDDGCDDFTACGHQKITDVAAVNLATLCAWAAGYDS